VEYLRDEIRFRLILTEGEKSKTKWRKKTGARRNAL
jgi:hypothetical protein